MRRRCSTTAPRCGVCPVAAASRSKNGICTDACRARYGGSNHHTRIGSGSRMSIHGQASSNMVHLDPAIDEAAQRIQFVAARLRLLVGAADEPSPDTSRKLLPTVA